MRIHPSDEPLQSPEPLASPAALRSVVEHSWDGILLTSAEGVVHYANPAATRITGYPMEKLLGGHALELVYPDDLERVQGVLAALLEQPGATLGAECRFRHQDGSWRWVEFRSTNLLHDPSIGALVANIRDQTERKQHEEALAAVAEGVSAHTGSSFFRSLVLHLARALGLEYALVAEVTGARGEFAQSLAVCAEGQLAENIRYPLAGSPCEDVLGRGHCCYPDGVRARFPLGTLLKELGAESYVGSPLLSSDGQTLGLIAVMSRRPLEAPEPAQSLLRIFASRAAAELERRRWEQERRRAHALLEAVVEGTTDTVFVKDMEGRYLLVNTAGAAVVDRTPAEVMGLTDLELFPPEMARQMQESDRRVIVADQPIVYGEVATIHGSPRSFQTMKAPYRDGDGRIVGVLGIARDVTDLRRTEADLRRAAVGARCLLWHADVEDRGEADVRWYMEVSDEQAAQAFFPVDTSDGRSYGIAWYESRLPEDMARSDRYGAEHVRAGRGYTQEFRCRRRDGEIRWLWEDVQVESVGPGRWHAFGICVDITERKQAEEALAASEARFASFMEYLPGMAWIKDADGRYVYANPMAEAVAGVAPGEGPGKTDAMLFPPELAAYLRQNDQVVLDSGKAVQVTEPIPHPDGVHHWLNTKFPIRDASGTPFLVAGVGIDITDRERAEERTAAFQALGKRLNTATTPEEAGRIILETADQLLGWDACWLEVGNPEERGTYTAILMDEVDGERRDVPSPVACMCATPMARKAVEEGALLLLRQPADPFEPSLSFGDTTRPSASIMCVPIRSGSHVLGTLSIQSYTFHAYDAEALGTLQALAEYCAGALQRTQAETERKRLVEQLEQARKMEAIGKLAGGIAHDFNNMLSVINGHSELLLEVLPPNDPSRHGVEEINKAGHRSAVLVKQLLAFSRRQVLAPRVLRLSETLAQLEGMLRRLLGEDVALSLHTELGLGHVRADPGQMEQVLVNLAVNARDAMPKGGRLTISARNAQLTGPAAQAAGVGAGPYVLLTVEDEGEGMDPETLARVFEPFFTTKETGRGTGLGLATVYGIVRQSGGHIEARSEAGAGSTFLVYLPRVEPEPEAGASPEPAQAPRGTETLLLVEDEPSVRTLLAAVLRSQGYTVWVAGSGAEAQRLCHERQDPIHLLVTDVVMPGMSGSELAAALTRQRPGMRVLYMSGYTEDAVVRHGVQTEQGAFIHKPFSPAALARKVREVLG